MRTIVTATALALFLALFVSQQKSVPSVSVENQVTQISPHIELLPPLIQSLPSKESKATHTKAEDPTTLEDEIANLNHEIEQGRYIERINDDGTPDYVKKELRERMRLMVRKTIALTRLNLQKIDQGKSI